MIENPFGERGEELTVYNFEILEFVLRPLTFPYVSFGISERDHIPHTASVMATNAFVASLILIEDGMTPLKLLNPREHD